MKDVIVNIEFNFSGNFVDKNGKYCTTQGSYFDEIIVKDYVLLNFDCMAYITCPYGQRRLHLHPKIDADDFQCIELDIFDILLDVDETSELAMEYGSVYELQHEAIDYLYDKDYYEDDVYKGPCWKLKEEIREDILYIINENLKSYIEEHGFEELYEMHEWNQ